MREYITKCTECLREIKLHLDNGDKRRNAGEFFKITCPNCGKESFAKIFETLVTYPHKLSCKEEV